MSGNAPTPGQVKEVGIHLLRGIPAEPAGFEELGGWKAHLDNATESHKALRALLCLSPEEALKRLGVNPYAAEDCDLVAWRYPEGWSMPSLEEQAARLGEVFGFEPKWSEPPKVETPIPTDGIAIWPCLSFLGKFWDIEDVYGAGYGSLIAMTCKKFGGWSRAELNKPLMNYREGKLTPDYVRLVPEVKDVIIRLETEAMANGFDCLAMPVNMGDWQTGKSHSPRSVLWQALHQWKPRGLAIEPVAGLSMVMATRILTAFGHQWKWFSGAQYNWEADGKWSYSLCLNCYDSHFRFDARGSYCVHSFYGSPVVFPGVI